MPTATASDVALISRVREADAEARAAQTRVFLHAGGPSCDCNIAPLCRHHHQLKTHAGWGYSVLDAGLWLWSDPHGQQFLRDRVGATDVTPARRCRRQE